MVQSYSPVMNRTLKAVSAKRLLQLFHGDILSFLLFPISVPRAPEAMDA